MIARKIPPPIFPDRAKTRFCANIVGRGQVQPPPLDCAILPHRRNFLTFAQFVCENRCALSQIKIGNLLVSAHSCRFIHFACFCCSFLKLPILILDLTSSLFRKLADAAGFCGGNPSEEGLLRLSQLPETFGLPSLCFKICHFIYKIRFSQDFRIFFHKSAIFL